MTFLDWQGQELAQQQVWYQASATPPEEPQRTGYTFEGWDQSFASVEETLTVRPIYAPISLTLQINTILTDSGGNIVEQRASNDIVSYDQRYLLNLNAIDGYRLVRELQSSCPVGAWQNAWVYQTGIITQNCAIQVNYVERNAAERQDSRLLLLLLSTYKESTQ